MVGNGLAIQWVTNGNQRNEKRGCPQFLREINAAADPSSSGQEPSGTTSPFPRELFVVRFLP
jgi:hypothetical protein